MAPLALLRSDHANCQTYSTDCINMETTYTMLYTHFTRRGHLVDLKKIVFYIVGLAATGFTNQAYFCTVLDMLVSSRSRCCTLPFYSYWY